MRIKFILIFTVALAVVFALIVANKKTRSAQASTNPLTESQPSPPLKKTVLSKKSYNVHAPTSNPLFGQPVQTESVEESIQKLEILGSTDDGRAFEEILAELRNPNPNVRQAALDALIQFGNRDAIATLNEVAAQTEDAREKVNILDVIDFLNLPTAKETRDAQRGHSKVSARSE
ncbi:MAG: HEAT repeat domain-containing protein [Verrucomicrobiota bacterium]